MTLKVSEADWATTVEGLLDTFGWRWQHTRPANSERGWRTPIRGNDPDGVKGKGVPDYVAVRRGLLVLLEIKSDTGKLSPAQRAWGKDLQAVADHSLGVMYLVARPADYETVLGVLR